MEINTQENSEKKDFLTNRKYVLEYELYQSYERFNVYHVYKKILGTEERTFLYNKTKPRCDFGKRFSSKKEFLEKLRQLEEIDGRKGKY